MDSLKRLALGHRHVDQTLVLCISEELRGQQRLGVLLLLSRPVTVFLVNRGPVVVDVFIDIVSNSANNEANTTLADACLKVVAEEIDKEEDGKGGKNGPFEALAALACEDRAVGMLGLEDFSLGCLLGKVLVGEQLVVAGHPVAEGEIEQRGELQLVEDVLA